MTGVPLGARTRSGPYHANMIESHANDPGLVVLAPSTPQQAYDMIVEASALPDPVLILEHIGLYGLRGGKRLGMSSTRTPRPMRSTPRRLRRTAPDRQEQRNPGGRDVTLVTWGAMVHLALQAASTWRRKALKSRSSTSAR